MKLPVSTKQNTWFDSENVDNDDLSLEQNYNNQIQKSLINNHFGTGIIADSLVQQVLFDSTITSGLLDGYVDVQAQPTDQNYGTQLEVQLVASAAAGNRSVKLLVIGLDFESNLQYDTFTFYTNETQTSSKHYTRILKLFFNDFVGTVAQSLNLGGQLYIREAIPFALSRDCKMVSQDVEPNIFFRDFFVSVGNTLAIMLQAALPSYNINNLNIKTGYRELRSLIENDVSSQIGEKFLATTNNIQKITLLMSVIQDTAPSLVWSGDIIVSIYQLQSSVNCPTDIVPSLAIDFDPSNIPLAQLVLNYTDLQNVGITLNTVPQPVDFVFSNTGVANGNLVQPGTFYAVTMKRAGDASKCQISLAVGGNNITNSMLTIFNGSVWVDIPEEQIWFQVWTDAAKVSDGQAYDSGQGMQITKTAIDPNTGATIDNSVEQIQFVRNDVYYAHAYASELDEDPVQDERTGNPIFSTKQFVPTIELINSANLLSLEKASEPLLLGTIKDTNVKTFSSGSATLSSSLHTFSMIKNKVLIKVITDTSDGYRYDASVINLVSALVNNELENAKFIPNVSAPSLFYRVAKADLLTMLYGDVDGDGLITQNDLIEAQNLFGADLNIGPTDPNYITLTNPFTNNINLTFQVLSPLSVVVASGVDGQIIINPNDGSLATFKSVSATFTSAMDGYSLVVTGAAAPNLADNGTFTILTDIDAHNLSIQKPYYTADTIAQIFRADITNDMIVDTADGYWITSYINKAPPFPFVSSPGNRVGTSFQVIELTLEQYTDRNDDYPSTPANRASLIHILPDIYQDGSSVFAGNNFKTTPIAFQIIEQLNWEDYMVAITTNPRLVPVAFEYESGYNLNACNLNGIQDETLPIAPSFDPGRNDFFLPNNLIMNYGGNIIRPDGYYHKIDVEIGSVIFDIPAVTFTSEKTINLFTDFISNYSGTGRTRLGYESMRFADCSFVGLDALAKNQLLFSVGLQSMSPQLSGTDLTSISGVIVDGKVGVSIDFTTGILTLNFSNLYEDPILQTLNTKVQVNVFIKKSGWNNTPLLVNSTIAQNILGL